MKFSRSFLNLSFAFFGFLVLSACNKNQKTVRKLDGTWEITEYTKNGENVLDDGETMEITFDKCNLDEEGPCKSVLTTFKDGAEFTKPADFTITEDGDEVEFSSNAGALSFSDHYMIEKLRFSNLILVGIEAEAGQRITLKKKK